MLMLDQLYKTFNLYVNEKRVINGFHYIWKKEIL